MEIGSKILSDIVVFSKYARYLPDQNRRETWNEIVDRSVNMYTELFPELTRDIEQAYEYVRRKEVMPSMRSCQFAGAPILKNNARIYNCSYLPINHYQAFAEVIYLLLLGVGVGWSVRRRHVYSLPSLTSPGQSRKFVIADSIEGWADSVKALMKAYLCGASLPRFDFSDIRPKGSPLSSGGLAPGPEPLRMALEHTHSILRSKDPGDKLTTLDVHDILCHLSDAVLAGGIRRSAAIALFDMDDPLMLSCKSGAWWELNPQRGRANNSVSLLRGSVSKEQFEKIWKACQWSNAGEPGIFWTSDPTESWGTNPCGEIGLRPFQFCNLTTINASNVADQDDLEGRVWAATVIGTLQATFTDFQYLRPIWRTTTEKEALLGVSLAGIAAGRVLDLDMKAASMYAKGVNAEYASRLGINPAARVTTVKPDGTGVLVMGENGLVSSGIHAYHSEYGVRRMRLLKNEPVYRELVKTHGAYVEDDHFNPDNQAVLSIPFKAPVGAKTRSENPLDLLERVKRVYRDWVVGGHNSGINTNNVSVTVSIKDNEWDEVGEWVWNNRASLGSGVSCLPYDGGTYVQTPLEETSADTYYNSAKGIESFDITTVKEFENNVVFEESVACAGGACEINRV